MTNIDFIEGTKGYSKGLVSYIVYHEQVKPGVDEGIEDRVEPNWAKIEKGIASKYGHGYEHTIIKARVKYYHSTQQWKKYATWFVRQIKETNVKKWPPGHDMLLNNDAFEVFKYSYKRKELAEALSWINIAIATRTNQKVEYHEMDTKANLLYKLGRRHEGIALEEQATKLAPTDKVVQDAYVRMKKGLPTWQ